MPQGYVDETTGERAAAAAVDAAAAAAAAVAVVYVCYVCECLYSASRADHGVVA